MGAARSYLPLSQGVPSEETPAQVPKDDHELTAGELANRLSHANNYCAASEAEVNAECAASSLRTCNVGDPPCTQGNGCYENVVCKIVWSDVAFDSDESAAETETAQDSLPNSGSPLRALVPCNGRCLRPLSANECMAGGDAITSLPDCLSVAVGEMCEHRRGECGAGAQAHISACAGGRDILMRVFEEQCSAATTEPPSTHASDRALPPPSHAPLSSKPTSPEEFPANSAHVDTSDGTHEEFFGPSTREGNDWPGAWWTLSNTNGATRTYRVPIFCYFMVRLFH